MIGQCALCQQQKPLRRSHLVPAAVYKLVRKLDTGEHDLVHVGRRVSVASSLEIRAHLLCTECEQRFHENGESYTLKNCFRGLGDFPLREVLVRSGQPCIFPEATMYATRGVAGVETGKLVYFAASVFWRSSVGRWKHRDHRINIADLGPFQEDFRLYLLGKRHFPSAAVMLINISSREQPTFNAFTFPYGCRVGTYHQFSFNIPGIDFHLLVGKRIPEAFYNDCCHHSPEQYVGFMDNDECFFRPMLELLRNSKPVGKLGESIRQMGPRDKAGR